MLNSFQPLVLVAKSVGQMIACTWKKSVLAEKYTQLGLESKKVLETDYELPKNSVISY
jgi:hypothetical protein